MSAEGLKNLELKAYRRSDAGSDFLKDYFIEVLHQTDTYYKTTDGRLKLREEQRSNMIEIDGKWEQIKYSDEAEYSTKIPYVIRYDRTDNATERECVYDFYSVPDANHFRKVFEGALTKEVVVKKYRTLYLYKNARIHLDRVDKLDTPFIEIEVVIRSEYDAKSAPELMSYLLKVLAIKPEDKLGIGYRELLLNK